MRSELPILSISPPEPGESPQGSAGTASADGSLATAPLLSRVLLPEGSAVEWGIFLHPY